MNFSLRCLSCEKTICHIDDLPVTEVASLSYKGDIFPLHIKCHNKLKNGVWTSLLDKIVKPKRSKREDLCCEDYKTILRAYEVIHGEYCYAEKHSSSTKQLCLRLEEVIERCRMRCSEHGGNTVRDK